MCGAVNRIHHWAIKRVSLEITYLNPAWTTFELPPSQTSTSRHHNTKSQRTSWVISQHNIPQYQYHTSAKLLVLITHLHSLPCKITPPSITLHTDLRSPDLHDVIRCNFKHSSQGEKLWYSQQQDVGIDRQAGLRQGPWVSVSLLTHQCHDLRTHANVDLSQLGHHCQWDASRQEWKGNHGCSY